ncbi:MAG: FadR family transcriptional regulator [Deltaproteobacteria bacterium]|nr:FadR family transcriptional regulator [Deltaproteobacteria bacterium]
MTTPLATRLRPRPAPASRARPARRAARAEAVPPPARGATTTDTHSPSETAFEALIADIVQGTFPAGSRLPAERDLAKKLGTSRPTLREALGRLAAWNLIDPRRGSGVVVRDRREWSIEVLPAYLRHGGWMASADISLVHLVEDLLSLRRSLLLESVGLVAKRLPPGGTDAARRQVALAWERRDDPVGFVEADLGVIRELVAAAGFLPAVWLLNRLASVYIDLARVFTGTVSPPADYRESHEAMLTALEKRQPAVAGRVLGRYLERHDQRLLRLLRSE